MKCYLWLNCYHFWKFEFFSLSTFEVQHGFELIIGLVGASGLFSCSNISSLSQNDQTFNFCFNLKQKTDTGSMSYCRMITRLTTVSGFGNNQKRVLQRWSVVWIRGDYHTTSRCLSLAKRCYTTLMNLPPCIWKNIPLQHRQRESKTDTMDMSGIEPETSRMQIGFLLYSNGSGVARDYKMIFKNRRKWT